MTKAVHGFTSLRQTSTAAFHITPPISNTPSLDFLWETQYWEIDIEAAAVDVDVDVEGCELEVLLRGERSIRAHILILLMEIEKRKNVDYSSVFKFLPELKYNLYI